MVHYEEVFSECNVCDLIESFEAALKNFGLNVYEHPSTEGSDMIGLIITRSKLSKKDLKEIEESYE